MPEVPTQTAAPVVQQAVARDDSPIAPVAQQRPGFQTVAYTVSSVETVPVAVPPAAKPEPKRPAVRAAKSADPLAGLLDGINTAPADARKAVTK